MEFNLEEDVAYWEWGIIFGGACLVFYFFIYFKNEAYLQVRNKIQVIEHNMKLEFIEKYNSLEHNEKLKKINSNIKELKESVQSELAWHSNDIANVQFLM